MVSPLQNSWEKYFHGTLESGAKYSTIAAAIAVVAAAPLSIVALSFSAGWGVVVISKIVELGLEKLRNNYPEKKAIFGTIKGFTPIVLSVAFLVTFFALSFFKIQPFLVIGLFLVSGFLLRILLGALGSNVRHCLEKN